ncbi:50S ribosomal protein L21 [Caldimicrobium thiodismutans]|uniref:Large ribosomal subunit protein bL21 n=1 Tax=Caldimicrobium thiodismutans TaxID=1653476 RepID=A0A0U5AGF8_9BACT|nr:50S ribosomal protein L21 [Caldimicrobium thiodismutans]BAU23075.1 50S ribosomal protein L21 [Caldimicrobium thiodismutans]
MFAVIKTGGKQYVVKPGDRIRVEKLEGKPGDSVEIKDVLLVKQGEEVKVGDPFVSNAMVTAEIVEQGRAPKVIVFKKKPKKGYKRKKGHRQFITTLEIKEIKF